MHPIQPIHRCERCGLLRPLRRDDGVGYVCIDCHREYDTETTA